MLRGTNRTDGRWTRSPAVFAALAAVLLLLLTAAGPGGAWALTDDDIATLNGPETTADQLREGGDPPGVTGLIGRLAIALGAVLGLMALVTWAAKRWLPRGVRPGGDGAINILATRPLGQQRSLVLVKVYDRHILLGATPHSIQSLSEFEPEAEDWDAAAARIGLPMAAGEREDRP